MREDEYKRKIENSGQKDSESPQDFNHGWESKLKGGFESELIRRERYIFRPFPSPPMRI